MNRFSICTTLSLAAFLLTPTVSDAQIVAPSKNRKVRNGIGNCIFSTKALGFKKEAGYKLKTKFTAPERVYSRCYFAKSIGAYRSLGKLKSQLRGDGRNPPRFNRRLQFSRPSWYYAHTVKLTRKNEKWDQNRLDIVPSGVCDFKKKPRTGKCIDLEQEVRNLAKSEKASLPYTAKICVHIDFDIVNKRVPNPKNRLQLIDKNQFHTVSKGCFEYTVN